MTAGWARRTGAAGQPPQGPGASRSVLRFVDLLAEATAALTDRPGRALMSALGTVLGVASFVAVLGLTSTASSQISERFTALVATQVSITRVLDKGMTTDSPYPADADRRIAALNGVVAGGRLWPVAIVPTTARPQAEAGFAPDRIPVLAASPGALTAMRLTLAQGRPYDSFHESRRSRVAMVGRSVAGQLQLGPLGARPRSISIDGKLFDVIGVIDEAERQPEVLLSVVVPTSTAQDLWGPPPEAETDAMLIETEVGAAPVVARQSPLALRPHQPDRLKAVAPPDPSTLRDQVGSDLGTLLTGLSVVGLVLGAVGIANTMLVSVLERVPEIGLRRALGARPRHVAGQFLMEGLILGATGGVVGTAIGVATMLGIAIARGWSPVIEFWAIGAGPALGALTGLVASAYPALRAALIPPVDALRSAA